MNLSQMLAAPRERVEDDAPDHRPSSSAYLDAERRGDQATMDWCRLPAEEQVRATENRSFERRLTALVQRLADDGVDHASLEQVIQRERARRKARRAQESAVDVPCKNWRVRIDDPGLLELLGRTWAASVRDWIRRDPSLMYIANPSAPCECRACDPAGFRMRLAQRSHVDEFGPMSYPEAR